MSDLIGYLFDYEIDGRAGNDVGASQKADIQRRYKF